jgi:hypothetical protein
MKGSRHPKWGSLKRLKTKSLRIIISLTTPVVPPSEGNHLPDQFPLLTVKALLFFFFNSTHFFFHVDNTSGTKKCKLGISSPQESGHRDFPSSSSSGAYLLTPLIGSLSKRKCMIQVQIKTTLVLVNLTG